MKRASAMVGVLATIIWMALADHAESGQDTLAAAESAAKAGDETPEGIKSGETLGRAFGRKSGIVIQRCAKKMKRPDLSDLVLFLRVDGAGVVDRAMVKPATNLATCVQLKITGWKNPAPPHAGFWVKVAINLRRKQPAFDVRVIGPGNEALALL